MYVCIYIYIHIYIYIYIYIYVQRVHGVTASEVECEPDNERDRVCLGIHYRGAQWEGGAVDGGCII